MALTDPITVALGAVGVPVGIGGRPANVGTKPFVVIWPDAPVRSAVTMKANDGQTTTLVCHCLGLTPAAAVIAERKLADALYGLFGATVDGRVLRYPEQLSSLPLTRDDDVSPPLYDLAVEWRLRTTPS